MRLDEFRERLLSMPPHEVESFVFDVLRSSARFSDVATERMLGGAQIDIEATAIDLLLNQPVKWYFEITVARALGLEKIERELFLKEWVRHQYEGHSQFVLIAPGGLTPAARERARLAGLVVWDAAKLLDIADPDVLRRWFGTQIDSPAEPAIDERKAEVLSQGLDVLAPGAANALTYQRLIADILTYLFCPPLELPRYELLDATSRNRRDIILENSAASGFWLQLRERYRADYIVVDAKNYTDAIKKRPVVDIAHYLKPYGCGMFGMIVTRQGTSRAGLHALREQWVAGGKMIVTLNDADLRAMLSVRAQGGSPDELLRIKIADFRMSL